MRYESIPERTPHQADEALGRDDVDELRTVGLAAALNWDDLEAAEALCLRLAAYHDPTVRGNAVLGLGHLARRFGTLSAPSIGVVESALRDPVAYVAGQAEAAQDDISTFIGSRPEDKT